LTVAKRKKHERPSYLKRPILEKDKMHAARALVGCACGGSYNDPCKEARSGALCLTLWWETFEHTETGRRLIGHFRDRLAAGALRRAQPGWLGEELDHIKDLEEMARWFVESVASFE